MPTMPGLESDGDVADLYQWLCGRAQAMRPKDSSEATSIDEERWMEIFSDSDEVDSWPSFSDDSGSVTPTHRSPRFWASGTDVLASVAKEDELMLQEIPWTRQVVGGLS